MLKKTFCTLLGLSVLSIALVGCKADDDGPSGDSELWEGNLAAAPFAKQSARFELSNAPYSSIEFTGNGLYYIVPAGTQNYYAKGLKGSTRDDLSYSGIKCGDYKVLADGTYDLEGWGTLRWDSSTNKVDVTLDNGESHEWDAEKEPEVDLNELNARLCRTWQIYAAYAEFYSKDNKLLKTINYTKTEIEKDFVEFFTFAPSGKYYECDYDGEWYDGTWRWSNPSRQMLFVESEETDGLYQIFFKNNEISIMYSEPVEEDYEYEDAPSGTKYIREYLKCKNYIPN